MFSLHWILYSSKLHRLYELYRLYIWYSIYSIDGTQYTL